MYSFVQHLITQLLEVTSLWTQETMQLRTVCDKRLISTITSGSFDASQNFYRHSANLILGFDFLRLFDTSFKKT